MFLMHGRKDVVIYQNTDSVDEKYRFIADANMMYLTDNQEIQSEKLGKLRGKPFVFVSYLPDMSQRAVISKSAEDTVELLDYACNSDLFDFGDISKTEFATWKDNDLYTDKDGNKYMPLKLFEKIKHTYKKLRGQFNYTHNLKDLKLTFHSYDLEKKPAAVNCAMSLKLSFFVPIVVQDI
ncbi:hypothetical protein CYMTET_3859 [Cymbomonas tetramitiformis]|uniref:Uncharacterized protein n=1 Tax=Cymbomonas tetramitiformis TaxID=36881 RepID=A0AAE0GWP3_9CHLO|nr:hypothetical protein CYMTET_6688 [Cymbomonas tetramitiformis]KAK3288641.1 hypothetical protein CYMTET_3859 [Cymbomonas tetramitiformis]